MDENNSGGIGSVDAAEAGFLLERQRMVDEQIKRRGIEGDKLLQALRSVPRHWFVPESYREMSYGDGPLPIGEGQTISQPYIVALMSQLLALEGTETVLEIGTGSGYQAAILGQLARQVYTIERHPRLAERAGAVLKRLNQRNVQVYVGDGSLGLVEHAPYEAIVVTAAAPEAPRPLLQQLAPGGRLVIPVGSRNAQNLERWLRTPTGFEQDVLVPVAFVPLRGQYGWPGRG